MIVVFRSPKQQRAARSGERGLVRFLVLNAAIGAVLGLVFLAALIASDVANLRSLLWNAREPFLPLAMLAGVFAITFGAAVMGTAVMALKPFDDKKGSE